MAIDSRNKRFSLMGLAVAAVVTLPTPDGAIDTAGERQQYLHLYSGITAGSPVVLPDILVLANSSQVAARRNTSSVAVRRNNPIA